MTAIDQPQPSWATNLTTRFVPLDDIEVVSRAKGGDGRTVIAYAALFDEPFEVQDQDGHYIEVNERGAFAKTLRERAGRIGVFYNHAKTIQGTPSDRGSIPLGVPIDLREDKRGWLTATRYNKTPLAEEVLEAIKSGSIRGMSYTGAFIQSDPDTPPFYSRGGDLTVVTRKEIAVREYGPTPIPANDGHDVIVGVRAQQQTDDAREVIRVSTTVTDDPPGPDAEPVTNDPPGPDAEPVTNDAPAQGASSVSDADEAPVDSTEEGTPAAERTGAAEPAAEPAEQATEEPPQPHSEDNHERNAPMEQTSSAASVAVENQTMTVEERKHRQSEIRARSAEIEAEFSGAVLPTDVQDEWDRIHDEHARHDRAIEASERRREQMKRLASDPNNYERADTGNGDGGYRSRGMPATHVAPDDIYDIADVRNRARSLEEMPALYRDRAMRAIEIARYPGVEDKESAQSRASHLVSSIDTTGELAKRMLITGSSTYERAFFKAVLRGNYMGLNGEEQRALTMGAADSAGLAVPFSLDPTIILTSSGAINPLRQIARVETITGKTWQGVTSAGITVTRAAESAEVGDNAPVFAQPSVTPQRVHAFVPFSIEAEQDWSQLRSEMTRLLNDGKETEEATSYVTGDGTGVNPDGVVAGLAAGSLVTANTITAASVYALESALPPRFRPRARFLASKSVYNAVRQLDTQGGAQLWERIGAGQPSELLGYPAHESSAMSAGATVGDRWLLFGDFSNFLIVDKAGMNVELVPHLLHTANNRPYGHRGLYAIWRNSTLILVDNAFRVNHKAA